MYKAELIEVVRQKESCGGFKRGEVKAMLQQIADKYGVPITTVSTFYYREVKGKVETEISEDSATLMNDVALPIKTDNPTPSNIDKRVTELSSDDHKLATTLRTPTLRPLKPPYHPNQEVSVEVVALKTYGAMCKILDEYEYTGLLHISEVKDVYVDDITEVFAEGDRFRAKVRQVDRDGKISFSTKGMRIVKTHSAPKMNSLADKLALIKDQITFAAETATQELAEHDVELDAELEEMAGFISCLLGPLTPKAKQRLKEVVTKHGIVKVTVEMVKASQELEADIGLAFVKKIERQIGDCL